MSRVHTQATPHAATDTKTLDGLLQRKCACGTHTIGGAECDGCRGAGRKLQHLSVNQAKAQDAHSGTRVQTRPAPGFAHNFSRVSVHSKAPVSLRPKLTLSTPGDVYEREADRVAEQVTNMPDDLLPRMSGDRLEFTSERPTIRGRLEAGRAGVSETAGMEAPPIVGEVLRTPGRPLDPHTRSFMEGRFAYDFSPVRVHTDALASESSKAVNARAYTVGNHIVFGPGEFEPQRESARRLLAHELTHVVQQGGGGQTRLFRSPAPAPPVADQTVAGTDEAELDALLAQITERTDQNTQLRQQLDALPETSSKEREELSRELDEGRTELIGLLQRRIIRLKSAIQDLGFKPESMMSSPDNPTAEGTFLRLESYERQIKQHEAQIKGLLRWQMRQRISSIDAEVAEIDAQLSLLPPVSDPLSPGSSFLAAWRASLVLQRKSLERSLLSGAVEYKQFDPRWGKLPYGECPTNVKEAGCGPASLAILLNYLYAEDPESVNPGAIEFVTPEETVEYAVSVNARVCGHGTKGATMVTQVSTQWPGFRGKSVNLEQAATELRGGNLIIFLCKNCTGQKKGGGKAKAYEGHFMVLSGVDDAGQTFDVLDPGRNEATDIETISKEELTKHTGGFWMIERK